MKITFLGTSSGVPTKSRNVSGVALAAGENKGWFLIDCGEATQHQLLNTKLSTRNLSAIFITHIHGDHCYGLPGLLASTAMSGRTEPLYLVGPKNIKTFIDGVIEATELFLTFPLEFLDVADLDGDRSINGIAVRTIELSHRVKSFAYQFTLSEQSRKLNIEKLDALNIPRGPRWGELQQGNDVTLADARTVKSEEVCEVLTHTRRVIICGDNDQPELVAREADLIIHESTYTQEIADKVGKGPQHSSAKMVAEAFEACKLPNLILTHFSARYASAKTRVPGNTDSEPGPSIMDIENEAKQYFSGNLYLANDLDTFVLKKSGELEKCKKDYDNENRNDT